MSEGGRCHEIGWQTDITKISILQMELFFCLERIMRPGTLSNIYDLVIESNRNDQSSENGL